MRFIFHHWVLCGILILLTALSWRYRFEIVPHPINQTTLEALIRDDPENAKDRGLKILETPDGNIIQIGRKEALPRTSSLTLRFENSVDLRAILIRCDYRWEDVVPGDLGWKIARGVFSDEMVTGWRHPADFALFYGQDSQDWRHLEVIRELPEAGRQTQINFEMLGKKGLLEIKDFSIYKVSERRWFPFTMGLLIIAWVLWISNGLRRLRVTSLPRKAAATAIFFAVSWITIFPQTSTLFFPVWGQFDLGKTTQLVTAKTEIKPKTAPQKAHAAAKKPTPPTEQLKKTAPPSQPSHPKPAAPLVTEQPPTAPTPKESAENKIAEAKNSFHNTFKGTVRGHQWLHLPAYALLAMLILIITNQVKALIMVVGIGILSEAVPPLMRYGFDQNDLFDLIFNLIGIGVGYLIWLKTLHLKKKLGRRSLSQA